MALYFGDGNSCCVSTICGARLGGEPGIGHRVHGASRTGDGLTPAHDVPETVTFDIDIDEAGRAQLINQEAVPRSLIVI